MFSYLKPNFSKHPLNYFLVLLVFIGSFSFTSLASAFEDDGTWIADYVWERNGTGNFYSTVGGAYSADNWPSSYRLAFSAGTWRAQYPNGFGGWSNAASYTQKSCAAYGYTYAACSETPSPPEPTSCQELADQNPDPFNMTLPSGYTMTACKSGCKVVNAGGVSMDSGGLYFGSFYYTALPCPGGFDLAAGDVTDVMDVYDLDEELQNCYTPDGILLGRVGVGMSCPQDVYSCYDSAGMFTGTAPGGSACAVGSKNFSTERPLSETSSTQKVCDAAGNCTTTSETQKTETGADGSKSSSKTTSITTCTSTGECTTETTTEEGACTGEDCGTVEEAVNGFDQCVNRPICGGDVLACESLLMQWESKCAVQLDSESLTDYLGSETNPNTGVTTDEFGQLDAIDAGEIDIADSWNFSSIFADSGRNGSCPADRATVMGQNFSYAPICDVATQLRYLVLFSAVFMSMVMIRKSIFGG